MYDITTKLDVLSIARTQLAIELNCSTDDFDRDGFVFCESKNNPGRRPFPRGERHFEMLTMGKAIIISATSDILPYVKEQFNGKTCYEAFGMPFVNGQGLFFLPDEIKTLPISDNIEISLIEQVDIPKLYSVEGFNNAIQYDENHPRPDVLAITAKQNDIIVGMAGCSADCEMMWQIGIDVLPEHRGQGLAAALTAMLAKEILQRGKVPYYSCATNHIASQRVAYRVGFKPAWMCVYRGVFDGEFTSITN